MSVKDNLRAQALPICVTVILTGAVFWFTLGREQDRRNDRQDYQIESLTQRVGELAALTGQINSEVRNLVVETRVLVTRIEMALPGANVDGR